MLFINVFYIMKTINPNKVSRKDTYKYMIGSIVPRPIAWVSTIDQSGNTNIAPYSYFNAVSSNPPVMIFAPCVNGSTGKQKDTLNNLRAIPECVINVVTHDTLQQCSISSMAYSAGISEFDKAGLTPLASEVVKPMRVAESPIHFECHVRDIIAFGTSGGAGNLVIVDVLRIHLKEDILDAKGFVDQQKIDAIGRMGGSYYARIIPQSLIEVRKPARNVGIGFDGLPPSIRQSNILTGNELGQLASVERLPTTQEITQLSADYPDWESWLYLPNERVKQARRLLIENNVWVALKLLLKED